MSEEKTVLKTEAALVREAKAGDERAFAELVRRHKEKAMELAYLAVGNYEDAKDISQDAFVKTYHSLKHFEMKSQFSTWFYRILMNTAKDFLRRKKWQKLLSWKTSEEMESFFDKVADPKASTGRHLLSQELDSQITEAIKKLPFQQRWIFTLRFLEAFSIQEISEVTHLSEGTVKATLHFAVQKFKNQTQSYVLQGGKSRG